MAACLLRPSDGNPGAGHPVQPWTPLRVKWKKVSTTSGPAPPPRHGHKAVVMKDMVIIFGGGNNGIFEDLHVFNTGG